MFYTIEYKAGLHTYKLYGIYEEDVEEEQTRLLADGFEVMAVTKEK